MSSAPAACCRRRAAGAALLLLVAACGGRDAPTRPAAPPPDVVLVVVDALRADRLGAAGYAKAITPNLDRLAGEGVLFTRAYAHATWTKPSIATLFTSVYPSEHGLVRLGREEAGRFVTEKLPRAATTLAERFRAGGYQTLAVVNQVHLQEKLGFAQGFDRYEWRRGKSAFELNAILRDALAGADARPLFAWVHYLDVHWPYNSRLPGKRAPELGATAMAHEPPQGLEWVEAWHREHYDEATAAALEARYDHEVAFVDAAIGELVEILAARGRWRDTLLLVTSDHGESFGAHGPLMHGHLPYEEQLHVPLLLRLPERPDRPTGRRAQPVGLVDVAPTLLDLAGLEPGEPPMRGRSLRPAIEGAALDDRPVFAQTEGAWSVRRGDSKLIALETGGFELYDLAADPRERTNLAAGGCDGPCKELLQLLRAFRAELGEPLHELDSDALTDEDVEELRALGYL